MDFNEKIKYNSIKEFNISENNLNLLTNNLKSKEFI